MWERGGVVLPDAEAAGATQVTRTRLASASSSVKWEWEEHRQGRSLPKPCSPGPGNLLASCLPLLQVAAWPFPPGWSQWAEHTGNSATLVGRS